MFGDSEVKLRSLTDTAGIFRTRERQKIEKELGRIAIHFPQIFVAVYTGDLGGTGKMRQYGFWLLNRAMFEDVPVEKPNEAGVLIVIDPDSKAAGITFGYLLDPFLDEQDTFDCLSRGHSFWLEENYTDGLLRVVRQLEKILKKRTKQAKRDPEKFERRVATPVVVGDLVKKIRRAKKEEEGTPEEAEKEVER